MHFSQNLLKFQTIHFVERFVNLGKNLSQVRTPSLPDGSPACLPHPQIDILTSSLQGFITNTLLLFSLRIWRTTHEKAKLSSEVLNTENQGNGEEANLTLSHSLRGSAS